MQAGPKDFGRAQRISHKDLLVGIPRHYINLLATQSSNDALNSHAAHTHASPHRINALLGGSYRHLRARASLSGDAFDLHRAIKYLWHLQL